MFASKADYRNYFAGVSVYLKMVYFLKQVGINQANFSRFMKGKPYDYLINNEKLDDLYQAIRLKIT